MRRARHELVSIFRVKISRKFLSQAGQLSKGPIRATEGARDSWIETPFQRMEILLLLLKFDFYDNNNNSVYNHTAICNSSPLRIPLNFSRSSDKSPYGAPYVNED